METVKTDGWYYQEVCQQPSDQSIDLLAADQKVINKVAADKAALDKLIAEHESGARLARQQAEAEKDKLRAEQMSAQQAAEAKAAAEKAAASCTVKVGDEVQLMSDGAKLDKIYAKQGLSRMLSTGAKGTVSKLERKGSNEGNGRIRNSMVKIEREGKEYWIPTKALAGFDNCEKVYVQAA
jgi:membrane protein involved in colicin uptake